jgi:hypothetical protein
VTEKIIQIHLGPSWYTRLQKIPQEIQPHFHFTVSTIKHFFMGLVQEQKLKFFYKSLKKSLSQLNPFFSFYLK